MAELQMQNIDNGGFEWAGKQSKPAGSSGCGLELADAADSPQEEMIMRHKKTHKHTHTHSRTDTRGDWHDTEG